MKKLKTYIEIHKNEPIGEYYQCIYHLNIVLA